MDSYTLAWGILAIVFGFIMAALFVVVLYISIRAAGIAWYKSKYEHLRKVLRDFGRNGESL